MTVHVIDATNKKIGRVASEAAGLLLAKNSVQYKRNETAPAEVHIKNPAGLIVSQKKRTSKEYLSYSGYPAGLRRQSLQKIITDKGVEEVLRRAVYGMLPKNKIRDQRIKNLKFVQ